MHSAVSHHRVSSSLAGLLVVSMIIAAPSYGVRLTHVRPIFAIYHELNSPSDISVSPDGRIYIVDGVNNSVRIFSRQGNYLSSFGKQGAANGEFQFPLGIDIGRSGKIYIADSGNHRLQIFDAGGGFIAKIDLPATTRHPADPTDVAADEIGNTCFVADNDNHRILVYDLATLRLKKIYGKHGTGKREFKYPFLISLDRDRNVYIVDVINTRVQVLNPKGSFIKFIGNWGVEKGEFFRPKGVTVDNKGRVYVSDSYMGVIQVFDSEGNFHSVLGDPEKGGVKRFTSPTGVFVDDRNRIYVVEMFANRVGVYRMEND